MLEVLGGNKQELRAACAVCESLTSVTQGKKHRNLDKLQTVALKHHILIAPLLAVGPTVFRWSKDLTALLEIVFEQGDPVTEAGIWLRWDLLEYMQIQYRNHIPASVSYKSRLHMLWSSRWQCLQPSRTEV